MKKYLSIWSMAFALCLSAQANAAICENTPTCESLGYKYSKAKVAELGDAYTCTACPLDGSKWNCVKHDNMRLCADYPYYENEKVQQEALGYSCELCKNSKATEKKYRCKKVKSCPTGFATSLSRHCDKGGPTQQCWNEHIVKMDYSGNYLGTETITNCATYPEVHCSGNSKWLSQYSKFSNFDTCVRETGYRSTTWNEYRCIKGYSGGKPCLSKNTVRHIVDIENAAKYEPCAYLYNAQPYLEGCDFN